MYSHTLGRQSSAALVAASLAAHTIPVVLESQAPTSGPKSLGLACADGKFLDPQATLAVPWRRLRAAVSIVRSWLAHLRVYARRRERTRIASFLVDVRAENPCPQLPETIVNVTVRVAGTGM